MHRSLAIVLLAGACAQGGLAGQDTKNDAAVEHRDGQDFAPDAPVSHSDAKPPDASTPVDAAVDAGGGGGGLFCNVDSDCTTAGDCCVVLGSPPGLCAPGTVVLGVCIPQ